MRWLAVAIAVVSLSMANAAGVAAYADMISADPAPGSTVSGSPSAIRVDFSQPLLAGSRLDLFTNQFQAVPGVTTLVAGSELHGVLAQPLAPATYTVQWKAVTDDGQTAQGSYQFAVVQASSTLGSRLGIWVAITATLITGLIAVFVFILNRRSRL